MVDMRYQNVRVGNIKVGSQVVDFNDAGFEVVSHRKGRTTLRCIKPYPQKGYGEGVVVVIPSDTIVIYDRNRENKKRN